ncbi:hypothetical protein DPMN_135594 [Dreissena polymorpha]|uniref:Uncharacterized protein n=1 Tax=Dreissena polymorpha TaxID=45954 RepID=A0A9D4JEU2_DREPO|nr:hypothetical protein DPMN_135594 [Dreissena polymorpha]
MIDRDHKSGNGWQSLSKRKPAVLGGNRSVPICELISAYYEGNVADARINCVKNNTDQN